MKTVCTLLLLAALVTRSAIAGTMLSTFSADLPVDFTPAAMAKPDADGIWVAGFAEYGGLVLVRYRNDGSVVLTREVPGYYDALSPQLASTPDGGVVLTSDGYAGSACELRRYDAGGALRWSNALPGNGYCPLVSIDGSGGVWTFTNPIYRLSADGAIETKATHDGFTVMTLLGDPSGPNAYLIGEDGSANSTRHAIVERISEHGEVLWKATPAQTPASAFSVGAASADGSVFAFGTATTDSKHTAIYGVKLDRAGHLLWQHTNAQQTSARALAAAIKSDGNAFVVYADPGPAVTLAKTGANGAFAWSTAMPALNGCDWYWSPTLRIAANGDVLIACDSGAYSYNAYTLRVSAKGAPIFSTSTPYVRNQDVQTLANSSELSLVQHIALLDTNGNPVVDANGNPISGSNAADLAYFDVTGKPTGAPQTTGIIALGGDIAASTFGPDGSAYLAIDAFDSQRHELARLAPDGHVVWRRTLSGVAGHSENPPALVLTASAMCLVKQSGIDCYAIADGATLGSTKFQIVVQPHQPLARVLDDGSLLVFYTDTTNHQLLLDANGNVLREAAAPYLGYGDINGNGDALFVSDATHLTRVARDGTSRAALLPEASDFIRQVYLADDGSALFFGVTDSASILTRIDAQNATSWTRTITAAPPAPYARYDVVGPLVVRGGYAYFVLGQRYGFDLPPPLYPYAVEKVALSDGHVAWSALFASDGNVFPNLLLDSNDQHVLLLAASAPNRLHTQVLDATTGTVVDDHMDDCAADSCTLLASAIGSDGAQRAIVDASNQTMGTQQKIFNRDAPFAQPPSLRLDQPGLDGAWYAPYESGQGFTLDYIASAQTLFMPWFTYARGNTPEYQSTPDPAGLAWYALYGTIAPGATSADLSIEAAEPGVFAAGIVGTRDVGTAHLSFSDCASGSLFYQFNADTNNGAGGLITLTRLSPSTSPCVLANGSTTPAQFANPAAQGFDARQSGSWFDPATSGQGMELTIIPANESYAGLVFAAWFTFDPAGAVDDAAHQHWFTLEGDLSAASSGAVSLQIMRTLGGTFDAIATQNTSQVGHATLTMQGCDKARLDYQFNDSDVAHAFAGIAGTTALVKIGGCAAAP